MFGHDDNQNNQPQENQIAPPVPAGDTVNPTQNPAEPPAAFQGFTPPSSNDNGADDQPAQAPATDSAPLPEPQQPSENHHHGDDAAVPEELLNIKQDALQQLSPLVSHLEQSPEEKFRTTMMMIQASDDQTLLREAYETAKQISDDKARAQALLDVVNENNYFTQQHSNHGN